MEGTCGQFYLSRDHEILMPGHDILLRGHDILMRGHDITKSCPQENNA